MLSVGYPMNTSPLTASGRVMGDGVLHSGALIGDTGWVAAGWSWNLAATPGMYLTMGALMGPCLGLVRPWACRGLVKL